MSVQEQREVDAVVATRFQAHTHVFFALQEKRDECSVPRPIVRKASNRRCLFLISHAGNADLPCTDIEAGKPSDTLRTAIGHLDSSQVGLDTVSAPRP
jgi:hypothetical protein